MSKRMMFRGACAASILALTGLVSAQALAPDTVVKVVVGYAAGGGLDAAARVIAPALSKHLGNRPVIVENRPGAGTSLAARSVARSKPDGATLMLADAGVLIADATLPNAGFNTVKDFVPIGGITKVNLALLVRHDAPFESIGDLIKQAKTREKSLFLASNGLGTPGHLMGESFAKKAGVPVTHVPYQGAAPAMLAVASGEADFIVASEASATSLISAGRLRSLWLSSVSPNMLHAVDNGQQKLFLDVSPTMFLLAPAGTPPATVADLSRALERALSDPEVDQALRQRGLAPWIESSDGIRRWMAEEAQSLSALIASIPELKR